jgi:hypothetical protein
MPRQLHSHVNKHQATKNNNRLAAATSSSCHSRSLSMLRASNERISHTMQHIERKRKRRTGWRFVQPSNFEDEKMIISHNLNFNFICAAVPKASQRLLSRSFLFHFEFLFGAALKHNSTNAQSNEIDKWQRVSSSLCQIKSLREQQRTGKDFDPKR